jgi:uncharacterized protein
MLNQNKQYQDLRSLLVKIAKERIGSDDPSHDLNHALRVLKTAEEISIIERADLEVVLPAALFHDLVNHPKNDPRALHAPDESADEVVKILSLIPNYPQQKLPLVHEAIRSCSFTKGLKHSFLEAQIVQDADGLEATGAIAIMRTFASAGQMKSAFYHTDDPFCEKRSPESLRFALDLFFNRLLKVKERMYTSAAQEIAVRRTQFLKEFLEEFRLELEGK